VGLLTVAGLTACGDKITVPPQVTTPVGTVVHSVTVSPSSVTLAIGGKATLAASVDADAGVQVRTVTWSSSNAAVATVSATGDVTAVSAGTATIIAKATADANVQGAAAVTVTGAGANPTVIISGINQTNAAGQSVPVNINNANGQIDVVLDVNTNGAQLRSVSATLACPNGTSMTQTQTIAGAASSDVEGAAVPVVLSFQTAAFNPTTGVPTLRNGACTLTASATTGSSTTPQTAQTTTQLTLNNNDGVVLTTSFAGYTNAEGVTTLTQANDAGGLPWRGGAVTISAVPVLYSGRTLSSVAITLPGAAVSATQTLTAAPYSATWSATSTTAPNVTGLTLVGAGFEANGVTPLGITPSVVILDNAGNDIQAGIMNGGVVAQTTFRLDNTAPAAPTVFQIAPRQFGWVNAAYTFTGVGGSGATANQVKYQSCGDGPSTAAAGYTCPTQIGVSAAAVSTTTGVNSQTSFTYYSMPFASYTTSTSASTTNGTSTSSTACSTTGWTKITTGADLAETLVNTSYVVRVFESDKLLNARCTDLTNGTAGVLNSGVSGAFFAARGSFGVDKTAPVGTLVDAGSANCAPANGCTTDQQRIGVGATVPSFFVTYIDNPLLLASARLRCSPR